MSTAKIVHTDQRYITALLQNNTTLIREIYERFAPRARTYILQNSGTVEEASDIFQEALVDIFQQARHKNFELTCPFEPFLLLVCKRKWLNEVKRKGRHRVTNDERELSLISDDAADLADQMQMQDERGRLFMEMFEKLGEKCREIIQKCLGKKSQEEVADELGLSYSYLRKKKSECTAELVNLIKSRQKLSNE